MPVAPPVNATRNVLSSLLLVDYKIDKKIEMVPTLSQHHQKF